MYLARDLEKAKDYVRNGMPQHGQTVRIDSFFESR
jgi:hypothetical protein